MWYNDALNRMAISEDLEAKRNPADERWRQLYEAEYGEPPELELPSHSLRNGEDLHSAKFLRDDDDDDCTEAGRRKKVLLMQIMTDGDGTDPGFVSDGVLQDPTRYEVFVHLQDLGKPLGMDVYVETYIYTAEDDGHDGSLYTHRGVAIMLEKCWQKLTGEKDAIDGHIITGPVAWAVEWTRDYWGVGWDFESHCVIGFYASKEEAEARAAMVDPDDPDVKRYSDFSEGVRQVKPYELRGNRRVRPEQVWACLLCAQALSDVVHAVFDTKEGAQAFWERREGCKLADLSKGMVDGPDGEHGVEVRCFQF